MAAEEPPLIDLYYYFQIVAHWKAVQASQWESQVFMQAFAAGPEARAAEVKRLKRAYFRARAVYRRYQEGERQYASGFARDLQWEMRVICKWIKQLEQMDGLRTWGTDF